MSRAGGRARRARLVAAGARPPETDADRTAAVGWVGWHAEVARRRAARIARLCSARLAREASRQDRAA